MDAVRAGPPARHRTKRSEEGCSPLLKQHTRSPAPRAAGAKREAPASAEPGGTRRAPPQHGRGVRSTRAHPAEFNPIVYDLHMREKTTTQPLALLCL